jgi:hypothetical protein
LRFKNSKTNECIKTLFYRKGKNPFKKRCFTTENMTGEDSKTGGNGRKRVS